MRRVRFAQAQYGGIPKSMARVAIDFGDAVLNPELAEVEDPGFVDLAAAGSDASGEFRCADCGYGAVVQKSLPPCPREFAGGDLSDDVAVVVIRRV